MDKNGAEAQKKLLRYSSAFASALEKKGGACLQRSGQKKYLPDGWNRYRIVQRLQKNAAVIRVIPGFWNEIIFVIRWESSWKAMNDFDLYMDSV